MCFPLAKEAIEKEWRYEDLQCVIARHDLFEPESLLKHRCGYVRVPPAHPFHGQPYDDINVDVHGGLTFASVEPCAHEDGIGYWIGFDCAHLGDASVPPGEEARIGDEGILLTSLMRGHYWTLPEVQEETERLADQVLAAK